MKSESVISSLASRTSIRSSKPPSRTGPEKVRHCMLHKMLTSHNIEDLLGVLERSIGFNQHEGRKAYM
ncbi:hypothetical protein F2Q69_00023772 [Brassica cretica]|uniref:Uncharacterized protein n=1 Tax=Brassica cretica TaxID=69181 RepID=A0A8S9QG84_BRACR|nr:hypothetical protein F2Q69_00023772 [Brassica cretica]